MVIVASHPDGDVSEIGADGTVAAPGTGARLVKVFEAVTERYTTSGISFFNPVGLNKCSSVAANGNELVFVRRDCVIGQVKPCWPVDNPNSVLIVAILGYRVGDLQLPVIYGYISNRNDSIPKECFWRLRSFVAFDSKLVF